MGRKRVEPPLFLMAVFILEGMPSISFLRWSFDIFRHSSLKTTIISLTVLGRMRLSCTAFFKRDQTFSMGLRSGDCTGYMKDLIECSSLHTLDTKSTALFWPGRMTTRLDKRSPHHHRRPPALERRSKTRVPILLPRGPPDSNSAKVLPHLER